MCEFIASLRCSYKCCGTTRVGGSYFAYSCQPRLESTVGHAEKNPGCAMKYTWGLASAFLLNSVAKSLRELSDLALSLLWWERILEFLFKRLAKVILSWSAHTKPVTLGRGWWALWLQLHAEGGCRSRKGSCPALSAQWKCIKSESQWARIGKRMGIDWILEPLSGIIPFRRHTLFSLLLCSLVGFSFLMKMYHFYFFN